MRSRRRIEDRPAKAVEVADQRIFDHDVDRKSNDVAAGLGNVVDRPPHEERGFVGGERRERIEADEGAHVPVLRPVKKAVADLGIRETRPSPLTDQRQWISLGVDRSIALERFELRGIENLLHGER